MSENIVFPDDKVAVTVLTNEDASSAAGALARKIAPLVLAGAACKASSAEAAAAEKRALDIFTGLQDGKLDRSQLTEFCDAYFTAEAVQDFASSLKPLGVPTSFKQTGGKEARGHDVSSVQRELSGQAGARDGV